MTRPSIVRADTIDLQDHDAPSAKDHQNRNGHGGAHQAETLREIANESAEENSRSPRLSWAGDDQHQQHQVEDLAAGVSSRMNQQEDALAVAQNGGVSSSDEGDMDGDDLDDDMMDRISSSPSIEDEDIDFEFVYALHTFVATVEGQANATKGDTMVLLDDSNSYWWLVRVVKDSSIGYLPAEHIETPTERLARLNKHRNVDLSATMLGDQAAKPKKQFRLKQKNRVTFKEPTYVDYNEPDFSSDEDDIEELFGPDVAVQQQQKQQQDQKASQHADSDDEITDDAAKVEPLRTRSGSKDESAKEDDIEEEERDSDEILDGRAEGPSRSRNGTVRNTDSFFKDDSVETKKITLTPNLLRDDSAARPSTDSTSSKDLKSRASLDKMDKELVADKDNKKKSKETKDKKEKEKKPSAIRSFFSRSNKKRTSEDDDESFGKRSMDMVSEPRDSEDPSIEEAPSPEKVTRSPSKLQKQPRGDPSPTRKGSSASKKGQPPQADIASQFSETRTNDVSNVPPASMRIVDPETQETKEVPSNQQQSRDDMVGLSNSALPRGAESSKPQKTVKAKARMELDESEDSSEAEEALLEEPQSKQRSVQEQEEKALRPQLPGAFPDSFQTTTTVASDQTVTPYQEQARDRLSESPVEVSPVSPAPHSHPPGLTADSPSPEGSPSPELGQAAPPKEEQESRQSWDDDKLRAFFDEGEHIRDLLAVVYDTSDVEPAGGEHPVVGGLFREQNAKLAEITTQLDHMLGDWLARKQRSRGTL